MMSCECCDWCINKWSDALDSGDEDAAIAYWKLHILWQRRLKEVTKWVKGCQYVKDVGMRNYPCENHCMYTETKSTPAKGYEESFVVRVHANKLSPRDTGEVVNVVER